MPETKLTSHLTAQTPLSSAINSWQLGRVLAGGSSDELHEDATLRDV